jgi:hypothetical protein
MLNVLITVDTEFWPDKKSLNDSSVRHAVDRDIFGATGKGQYGIGHQAALMEHWGLKGVFMVESLHASVLGTGPLTQIVHALQQSGQEVQLHAHPEWLRHGGADLPEFLGSGMWFYSPQQQGQIVREAAENLRRAGAQNVLAFRAGGFRANWDTLGALSANGMMFDTSHNTAWLGAGCKMPLPELLLQPRSFGGVYEFPVTFFCDWPGHHRHLEVCACSCDEMRNALMSAWRRKWHSVVIVMHSFEMLKRIRKPGQLSGVDHYTVRRFHWLCRFLACHRDKFRTVGFNDIDVATIPPSPPAGPLRSSVFFTIGRMAEQAISRLG